MDLDRFAEDVADSLDLDDGWTANPADMAELAALVRALQPNRAPAEWHEAEWVDAATWHTAKDDPAAEL